MTIPQLLYFDGPSYDHRYRLSPDQITPLITALEFWATGALYADPQRWSCIFPRFLYSPAEDWFRAHPTPLTAVQSIRYFKNGRVDITFSTSEQAQDFLAQFGPGAPTPS